MVSETPLKATKEVYMVKASAKTSPSSMQFLGVTLHCFWKLYKWEQYEVFDSDLAPPHIICSPVLNAPLT